tara:strand:- start:171 stop:1124 length:954 start_codon:yes stop_codon:yes gene_type:complete
MRKEHTKLGINKNKKLKSRQRFTTSSQRKKEDFSPLDATKEILQYIGGGTSDVKNCTFSGWGKDRGNTRVELSGKVKIAHLKSKTPRAILESSTPGITSIVTEQAIEKLSISRGIYQSVQEVQMSYQSSNVNPFRDFRNQVFGNVCREHDVKKVIVLDGVLQCTTHTLRSLSPDIERIYLPNCEPTTVAVQMLSTGQCENRRNARKGDFAFLPKRSSSSHIKEGIESWIVWASKNQSKIPQELIGILEVDAAFFDLYGVATPMLDKAMACLTQAKVLAVTYCTRNSKKKIPNFPPGFHPVWTGNKKTMTCTVAVRRG